MVENPTISFKKPSIAIFYIEQAMKEFTLFQVEIGILKVNNLTVFYVSPEPVVQWTRPPGLSLPLERHRIDDVGAKLTITNISSSDAGDYICSANNRNGRAEQIILIDVQGELQNIYISR